MSRLCGDGALNHLEVTMPRTQNDEAPVLVETARSLADRFITFLETGTAPEGLFAPDVFCDFTVPLWRLQAQGLEEVVRLRKGGHPSPGRLPPSRSRAPPPPEPPSHASSRAEWKCSSVLCVSGGISSWASTSLSAPMS